MKALILAAGKGTRIRKISNGMPKCLLKVNGKTIIEQQLNKLEKFGIEKKNVIVVTGYKADLVRKANGEEITYIHNKDYETTNSLYSLWLARNENFDDGMILLNADVIFHDQCLFKLINHRCKNALLVDFSKKLTDGEMNVIIDKKGMVCEISKSILATEAVGESIQIVKFSKSAANILFNECNKLIINEINDKFPTYVFEHIIEKESIAAVNNENYPWVEIDYPQDYERAKNMKF
jgi:choline kinase